MTTKEKLLQNILEIQEICGEAMEKAESLDDIDFELASLIRRNCLEILDNLKIEIQKLKEL